MYYFCCENFSLYNNDLPNHIFYSNVFFYADNRQTSIASFTIGEELRNNRVSYVNDTIILKLPNNKTLDDLSTMSVWCVDFSIDFGNLQFTP